MLPDRVSNPGPPTYESGALPIALRGPAYRGRKTTTTKKNSNNQSRYYRLQQNFYGIANVHHGQGLSKSNQEMFAYNLRYNLHENQIFDRALDHYTNVWC